MDELELMGFSKKEIIIINAYALAVNCNAFYLGYQLRKMKKTAMADIEKMRTHLATS